MPSAIDFLSSMKAAVDTERRIASKNGGRTALKDLLAKTIAEYNRLVTIKKHRIDGTKKQLIYNMFLGRTMYL